MSVGSKKNKLFILNEDGIFRNVDNESIAKFVISQLDLIPQYFANENDIFFTTQYKGSVKIFSPDEINAHRNIQLDNVIDILRSAFDYSKNFNNESRGEAKFSNDNGSISIELLSPNKDPQLDFPRQAILKSFITIAQQREAQKLKEKLMHLVTTANSPISDPTTAKIDFKQTELELPDNSTYSKSKASRSIGD